MQRKILPDHVVGSKDWDMSLDLQQQFLDAPFATDGWGRAMSALAEVMRSQFVNIGAYSLSKATMRPFLGNQIDHRLLRDVDAIGAYSATVNWRLTAVTAPFVMVAEDRLNAARREPLYKRSLYNDLVQTHDLPHGCQTVLAIDGDEMMAMWTHRGHAAGSTSADELELFQTVAPAVLKAVRLEQAIGSQGAEMLGGMLDTMKNAAFILGASGRVLALTPSAALQLASPAVLTMIAANLIAADRQSNDRLQVAISAALAAGPVPFMQRLWLRRRAEPQSGIVAELYSLPKREWGFGFEPRAIVVLRPRGGIDQSTALLLRQSFDLSPAEADVAIAIAQGLSRSDIARARAVSVETVNAQLKTIYRKIDINREAELVALVVQLAC
jgi:DNA-binding CsgD family transcriptional regulator